MDEVAGNTNNCKFTNQLDDVETFHRSRLYAYLLAREKYTGKISYIDYCINFGGENAKRYGPYNKRIAAMKVATSFMGRVPELRFEYKQKVYKDKDSVAQDTDMSMLTDQQTAVLADWLTLSLPRTRMKTIRSGPTMTSPPTISNFSGSTSLNVATSSA